MSTCLESVRGVFDEIVVVDTGSTDRTIEIARSFGAKVPRVRVGRQLCGGAERGLSHATGDYAFWLDADDVIEPVEREKLRALLAGLKRASATARPCVGSGDLTVRHSGQVMRPAPNAGPFPSGEHAGAADEPGIRGWFPLTRSSGTLSPRGRGRLGVSDAIRGRLCRALRLRSQPRQDSRQDRRRSSPAFYITRRCPLEYPLTTSG